MQPPLVTRTGAALVLACYAGALLMPMGHRWWLLVLAILWTLKVGAPLVNAASRAADGLFADALYVAGFLLPHVPSLALVGFGLFPTSIAAHDLLALPAGAVLFALLNRQAIRQLASGGLLSLLPPKPLATIGFAAFAGFLSALGQEILYRGMVFFAVLPVGLLPAVAASSLLFVAEHVANRWARRDFRFAEYAKQCVLAGLACLAVTATGSVAPAIFLHVGYNLGPVLGDLFRKLREAPPIDA